MSLNLLILCPSARLARSIQADIARQHLQEGHTQWHSPAVQTLSQWLECIIEAGLLDGEVAMQTPPFALSAFNEQLLWEDVITQSLKKNAFGTLFDVSGLASAAMEANRYMVAWSLHIPRELIAEESRQFLQWQQAFKQRCLQLNVLENVRFMDWQLNCIAQSTVALPAKIAFAGFDQTAPQEKRLREVLLARGVQVEDYVTACIEPAQTQHINLENQAAECRAAVAWAQQRLDENPNTKLAIVSPRLSDIRNQLADLLDDSFYPASVRPSLAEIPRHYNFSLGAPLAQQPIIQAALNLIRLLSAYQLQQADVSHVLLSPFWSASTKEADARAMLDAKMREKLPMQFTLQRFMEFATQQHENGLSIAGLLAHLRAAANVSTKKATPSLWAQTLSTLLVALNWPGERNISSLEYQAVNAWQKTLQQLAKLEVLGKNLAMAEATHLMQQICTEQVFQAETEHEPAIQILGIMEALSTPVDAIWCMHMNDHLWPPPARPNPLLPAFIQRTAALPNADNNVQATFAATIHQRLLHSAKNIIFSSSKTEGESQLRASPLMKDVVIIETDMPLAETLAEQLSHAGNAGLTMIDDNIAPVVRAGDHVSGGTGLLKAQAICPAWAFYQYRLGAKAFKAPTSGLDSMARGSLVHDVLERFWRKRHFADLRDMNEVDLSQALIVAIQSTLHAFATESDVASPAVLELEHERLAKLIGDWLQFEKARGISFNMVACEVEKQVQICGIEVTLKIDRIHQLESGELVFVDYKTGQIPKIKSWGEDRITEPQLPIYAAFYTDDVKQVAGVYFGMVKIAEHTFSGVGVENFEAEPDKRKPVFIKEFTDWQNLLTHWRTAIEAIAEEVKFGKSAAQFSDEIELAYCEVMPLLRLPERKLQFERFQGEEA
ncbi:MAG: PD-(D/E)XK nuclease family protein [Methylotenera sp.]|nr:PD-(D/E)XK nuclease family protein [Methylotenera sp.]MDP1754471.1 PD-(D/E)XK nuclease family protein [Methylotenera sp.]MDP1959170.1 PD-(D/E)XK nuclease family protein [Methylotenera sp.]MDP3303825.1 PD-(D/E)XK nuclease family protein [Methylotenera sp.]MDP3943038.1 PD-(D/E)XK nuclease family protein [Methylotenera sp.]